MDKKDPDEDNKNEVEMGVVIHSSDSVVVDLSSDAVPLAPVGTSQSPSKLDPGASLMTEGHSDKSIFAQPEGEIRRNSFRFAANSDA
jgi:hypothetical protein